jgi:hypothetical protein
MTFCPKQFQATCLCFDARRFWLDCPTSGGRAESNLGAMQSALLIGIHSKEHTDNLVECTVHNLIGITPAHSLHWLDRRCDFLLSAAELDSLTIWLKLDLGL